MLLMEHQWLQEGLEWMFKSLGKDRIGLKTKAVS